MMPAKIASTVQPLYLRGHRIPEEWLLLNSCLLPALTVGEDADLANSILEQDNGALLGWRLTPDRDETWDSLKDRLQAVNEGPQWLDDLVTGFQERLKRAGLDTDALDDLVLRVTASFYKPQYSWAIPSEEDPFSPYERNGAVWTQRRQHHT